MRSAILLGLTLLLTACEGDDGGTGVDSNAPLIFNLRQGALNFTPQVGQVAPQVFAVDYTDRGGDIAAGACELTVGAQTSTTALAFAGGSTADAGTVACLGLGVFRATPTPVRVVLIDGSGRRSNALTITGVVETRRGR